MAGLPLDLGPSSGHRAHTASVITLGGLRSARTPVVQGSIPSFNTSVGSRIGSDPLAGPIWYQFETNLQVL